MREVTNKKFAWCATEFAGPHRTRYQPNSQYNCVLLPQTNDYSQRLLLPFHEVDFGHRPYTVNWIPCCSSKHPSSRVSKSPYWGEMLLSPIHCCDVTKPPYLLSGELYTSPLHPNRFYVYIVCCRRGGQCFSVVRTRHTDVVGDSSGRS